MAESENKKINMPELMKFLWAYKQRVLSRNIKTWKFPIMLKMKYYRRDIFTHYLVLKHNRNIVYLPKFLSSFLDGPLCF